MNPSTCHMKYKLISEKSLRRKNKEAGDAGRGCVFQDPLYGSASTYAVAVASFAFL